MKRPKKPTRDQKELIAKVGLNPEEWLVRSDAGMYLKIVDKTMEQREEVTINKVSKKIVDM